MAEFPTSKSTEYSDPWMDKMPVFPIEKKSKGSYGNGSNPMTSKEYLDLSGRARETISPEKAPRAEGAMRVMLTRNVVNSIVMKLHKARPDVGSDVLEGHVHDVVDILCKPGKAGGPEKVSEYLLSKGYTTRNDAGQAQKLFDLHVELEDRTDGKITPRMAVGIMPTVFAANPEYKDELVTQAIRKVKRFR